MKKYILIILIPIIIILLNINILVSNQGFYTKYSSDVKDKEIYIQNILNYFDDKAELDYFTQKETAHLKDVKQLFKNLSAVLYIAITIFIFSLFKNKNIKKSFLYGGILSVIILAILTSLSFTTLFINFHEMFFQPGTWILPADSLLIKMFPEIFFKTAFKKILFNSFLLSIICIFVGLIKKQEYKIHLTPY